jgi:CRP/FNR family transcriptional regulator
MTESVSEKILTFFSSYDQLELDPKTYILRPNESLQYVYFLESGLVKQSYITKRGEESTLHIFTPGSYFPMMLIMAEVENMYYFEAVDNVVLRKAPVSDVLAFVKENNDVCFELASRFASGISGLLEKADSILFASAYQKVIAILLYFSEKFGVQKDNLIHIKFPLTHYDIASWVGIQRETVSRQLEKLSSKEILKRDDSYFLVDIEKLKSEQKRS